MNEEGSSRIEEEKKKAGRPRRQRRRDEGRNRIRKESGQFISLKRKKRGGLILLLWPMKVVRVDRRSWQQQNSPSLFIHIIVTIDATIRSIDIYIPFHDIFKKRLLCKAHPHIHILILRRRKKSNKRMSERVFFYFFFTFLILVKRTNSRKKKCAPKKKVL